MQYFFEKEYRNLHKSMIFRVRTEKTLDKKDIRKLEIILSAQYKKEPMKEKMGYGGIFNRSSFLSPWSSKAIDIIKSCNLPDDIEIEIGRNWLKQSSRADMNARLGYVDKMTEIKIINRDTIKKYFNKKIKDQKQEHQIIKINKIENYADSMSLALSKNEISYLKNIYKKLKRDPTDVELMMFSQINSEHCRHKIFNSDYYIDKTKQKKTLFSHIKSTYQKINRDVISAYKDNSSIIRGYKTSDLILNSDQKYINKNNNEAYIIKAETHNHPTAISPYHGAATGSGGEIRDEGATGRGSTPKIGFSGFTLSNLNIKHALLPWEKKSISCPARIKNALDIIVDAPIGAARYNNEFGRPNIFGYFRTMEFEMINNSKTKKYMGFHKPIMIAGGIGKIDINFSKKQKLNNDDCIVILGGYSYKIGLGGGAASSLKSGKSSKALDYASVQRDNAEIQRRCQEVINRCTYMRKNPIKSIHDVGAGGLSNAIPEIVNESSKGARIYLDKVVNAEKNMSPLEIWCNESQERYVIVLSPSSIEVFDRICKRENCPYYLIGNVTTQKRLVVSYHDDTPIDIPMSYLLGKPPITPIRISSKNWIAINESEIEYPDIKKCMGYVLMMPSVSDKSFLITIGDRSVSGLVVRDQMVGPFQVPVSNVAITKTDLNSKSGQVMTIGEKPNIAITDSSASVGMIFGEVLTNIASTYIGDISKIKMSANWMASSTNNNELKSLYDAVSKLAQFSKKTNITIPVGKDSLSMSTTWINNKKEHVVESPVSLVLSAFASIQDVDLHITPYCKGVQNLYLIDLGAGKNRMGGSALHQSLNIIDKDVPKLDDINLIVKFFNCIQKLIKNKIINGYHDKSDGGLFVTLSEIAFASNASFSMNEKSLGELSNTELIEYLFNEELGCVVAVNDDDTRKFEKVIKSYSLTKHTKCIGHLFADLQNSGVGEFCYISTKEPIFLLLNSLRKYWSYLSYQIQSIRDNSLTADAEYKAKQQTPVIHNPNITFKHKPISKTYLNLKNKPKIAIFREQGTNGHKEMANSFMQSGFDCYDLHTNDLTDNPSRLQIFDGLAICGGFSFGDVLGAGYGWANKILYNDDISSNMYKFFHNKHKFVLGVCNGCQMLSHIKHLIPGATHWPKFVQNKSKQFEARQVNVNITKSNSILFKDMEGSIIPIIVSHGEGRIDINNKTKLKQVTMKYSLNGTNTEQYPFNPNGSIDGVTGFCNNDGRVNIMMPHPERLFSLSNFSWAPEEWKISPWRKIFYNAREWIG